MFVAIIAFCVPNAVEAPSSEKIFYFVHSIDLIVFFAINVILPSSFFIVDVAARNYIKSLFFG